MSSPEQAGGAPGRSGRRPGPSGTRGAIADAARRQFSELGYDRTSMRQVGLEAGVDPALVTHYFRSKHQLFLEVIQIPIPPEEMLATVLAGDREQVGLRLARFVLQRLEDEPTRRRITSIIRAATAEPEAARLVREMLTRELLVPIAERLASGDAEYRAALVMSQVAGLVLARYIVGVEPLASRQADDLAHDVAPTLQRYLTGPLTD